MKIQTATKTTIEAIGHFKDGSFHVRRESSYDGAEERFDTLNFNYEIGRLDIPKGEYKITITLEKI